MKKPVTEEKTFCDFCEERGCSVCLVCGKDLCRNHRLELCIYLDNQQNTFRAGLCPKDAEPLLPILTAFQGKGDTWEKVGQNPATNEYALAGIFQFMGVLR